MSYQHMNESQLLTHRYLTATGRLPNYVPDKPPPRPTGHSSGGVWEPVPAGWAAFRAWRPLPAFDGAMMCLLSKRMSQALTVIQLRTCSFGRRGRPSYAVRTQAEVQRLCHFANVSVSETGTADTSSMLVDSQPARDSVGNVEPSRGTGVQGAAEVRVANTHDGCVRGDVSDTGTTNMSSMRIDEQPTVVRVGNAEPSSSTGHLRVPLYARSDISNCAVVPLDAHATCLDCVRHGLIAAGATDVPAPDILLATVVAAIAESWESMRFQVLHAHASSLPSTCTATQYGEALQQHRLLPGDVELAVFAHAFNIAITVFDSAGLQICYWGSSSAPTEVCLIRQAGLAGAPLPYRLLDMVPGLWTGQRRQHLVAACRAVGLCMSETPSAERADAEQHIPGYLGASWRSGPGHRLGISDRLAAWSAVTSMLLAGALVVCAMCGVTSTDLHKDLQRWATAEPVGAAIAPYSFHNSLHAGSTTTPEGLWHLCPHCAPLYPANSGNERAEYLVFHPPDYTKAIVSLDAIDQLRIGLVDVGLGFFSAAFGFVAGKLRQQHCMEALVLDWARDSTRRVNTLPPALQEVLGWSVQHNPLVREFLTVAEQVPPNHPLPYLCPADVQSFVASDQACKPLALATLEAAEAARSLISVVVPAIQRAAMKHAPVMYTAGTLVPRSPTRPELNLAVAADGTPLDYQFGLSAEMAMFPYLFPFGVGAFMGGTTLVKYLAYRAKCLFSVWTLCKPYLLLMYVLRQSARLQEQNTEAVLESALLDYKSQNPNASDEDAIHHILKHKLPATLPNTPAWHRSNLQDLLCMVDRFGMPSFFLTLTTDEVSATRWPEHGKFNVLLAEARKYRDEFLEQHHVKPASTYLYNITAAIHEGDMPDRATATHAEVMQLWIAAAGSLRADTAIELIYDYGMDAGTVLKTDQDFARSVLTAAQQARASGALLTTTTPAKRAASSPAEPDSSASPRTVYVGQSRDPQRRFQAHARNPPSRMKEDASRYQPFHDHFSLTRLMSTANPALAQRMEAFYIAQFKARGPGGYNVLCGPPSASPAFYAMRRQRAGSAHTPTAVTAQDNDDDAPDTLA
ncbi:hypothetical protein VOLCADRAFT_108666 [Volvox carteri f. nagariensis]|uniref:Uncharacterized protein n=1 Tax=Volvox carteri f. nagariensis TaxID=3068 RepID=D8ULN9_VOLCA|nr:uncharacterized protein VOLCADRAFT_108666 [Volvox carteri f. nagariensis]EFJ39362.1 hypothetical protein VOLCADRAFT_108666 [Volvox carteri f. nagariensis]|eukprot:XP_002959575.1 hypothetical protein VOLCADRAFT_108666 [Volvox carteri f. nagariensis]